MSDIPPLMWSDLLKKAVGVQLEWLYYNRERPTRVPTPDKIPTDRFCELFGYVMGYDRNE